MHSEKAALIEEVRRVIRASLGQRAKESLIVDFIECTDLDSIAEREDIIPAFYEFAQQRRDEERDQLIAEESLRPEAAHHFIDFSLRRGYASNQGTDLDEILPSRFRLSTAILALSATRCWSASLPSWRNSPASSLTTRQRWALWLGFHPSFSRHGITRASSVLAHLA